MTPPRLDVDACQEKAALLADLVAAATPAARRDYTEYVEVVRNVLREHA